MNKDAKTYVLEEYEWDNNWIEKSNIKDAKRVLYIGDSISCGTRSQLNRLADGEILFDGFGTSKAVDNPTLFPAVSLFSEQENPIFAVICNNGIHGTHLSTEEYEKYYSEFLDKLKERFKGIKLFVLLSTKLRPDERNAYVLERNAAARKLAEEKRLPVIDLYKAAEENIALQLDDNTHFTEEGYAVLAKTILGVLEKEI